MLSWLRYFSKSSRNARTLRDAICATSEEICKACFGFMADGCDGEGLDFRLRARMEIYSFLLHWASRTTQAMGRNGEFDLAAGGLVAHLNRAIAAGFSAAIEFFGADEFEPWLLSLFTERDRDYGEIGAASSADEFYVRLAIGLSDRLMPCMADEYRFDQDAHGKVIKVTMELMYLIWHERLR